MQGQWRRDLREGQGKLTYMDGKCYTGSFEGGCKEGLGEERHPNGVVLVGKWRSDEFITN